MSGPELSVVCKSCGSEVSPYVTECPYCGTRLRKRAPKLERQGDDLVARERRTRRTRGQLRKLGESARPYATYTALLAPAVLYLVQIAADLLPTEVGAIVGSVGSEWWRYLAAPWVFDDLGYLFVVGVTIAVFVPGLERRLGSASALVLLIACGALGMLAADGLEALDPGAVLTAAGGNGVALGALAAWTAMRHAETRSDPGDDFDTIGVAVFAVVLLALPLVEDYASVIAGLGGAVVGGAAGFAAARAGASEA